MKKGFTLIELLVVVLIIGILSSVALPQYQKAVFKARLAQVLSDARIIENCINEHFLINGNAGTGINFANMNCSVELTSGTAGSDNSYRTKYFQFVNLNCNGSTCSFWGFDLPGGPGHYYELEFSKNSTTTTKKCYTEKTDFGRIACKMFEMQGYSYTDEQY
ncbi:MAG: prepilin-type N-terminal cleavage/methylation domain-containing protein [Elusimicrobiaceae bacterium]|nr:prepilin-type N-terminal cleavage/methylation domain-containing protein [Elusimicrobiaceae bacterium]